jgi:hypothetical protein
MITNGTAAKTSIPAAKRQVPKSLRVSTMEKGGRTDGATFASFVGELVRAGRVFNAFARPVLLLAE